MVGTAPDPDLVVAYWKMEDNTDEVASHDLTASNTTIGSAVIDNGYILNGTSASLYVTYHADFAIDNNTAFSYAGWLNSTDADGGRIIATEQSGEVHYMLLNMDSNGLLFFGTSTGGVRTQNSFDDGVDHHIIVAYSGTGFSASNLKIFVDGVEETTDSLGTFTTGFQTSTNNIYFGRQGGGSAWLAATLDEWFFTNEYLDVDNSIYLYQGGSPGADQQYPFSTDSITLVTPNGGENLTVGQSYDITWTSSGTVGSLTIEFSDDNGSSYSNVATGESNDGTYSWTVPDNVSDLCLVRIGDGVISDVSDAVFSIRGPPDTSVGGNFNWVQSWLRPIQNWFTRGKGIIEFPNVLLQEYVPSEHVQIAGEFRATVVKVHDGDTVTLRTDFRDFDFPLRVSNVNAPEMNAGGEFAKQYLTDRVLNKEVLVKIDNFNRVGKYGRLIGELFVDGLDCGDEMLRQLIVPGFGEIKHRIEPFDKILKQAGYE